MSEQYSYRTRSMERMIRRRRRTTIIVATVVSIIAILLIVGLIMKLVNGKSSDGEEMTNGESTHVDEGYIDDKVYVETMSVGGMDYDTAVENVDGLIQSVLSKNANIDVNGTTITATLSSLGVSCDKEVTVDKAFQIEDAGVVKLEYTIDDPVFEGAFADEEGAFTKKPVNASLKRENGVFTIIKGKKGLEVDIAATKTALLTALGSDAVNQNELNITAVINSVEPEYTASDMKKCKDVLGKYATTFKESQVDRSANVRNATSFIDGTVIYPGETFSVAETIYPLSSDNGYREAPSYAGGQVVDSLGGGVCQVSTTLYNAVLLAELEVVERAPHSMVVSYVKPSMDAAIAGDYKDFKFKNNSDSPIYLQGYASGGILTFTVYGEEVRPSSRKIEYVSEIVETIEPGEDVVTKDKTQPESYIKVTQEAHVGYVAELYKVVYENGVQVSKDRVNTSRYKAEPKYVTVGTKKEKDKDKDKDKDKNKDNKNNKNNKDDVTDKTEPTAEPVTPDTDVQGDNTDASQMPTEAPVEQPVPEPAV